MTHLSGRKKITKFLRFVASTAVIYGAAAGAMAAMACSERNDDRAELQRLSCNSWRPLSEEEIATLRTRLTQMRSLSVVLVHRSKESDGLEESLGRLFDDLHWPRADGQGGVLDENPEGLSLMPDNEDTRNLRAAIQNVTGLGLEIRGNGREPVLSDKVILVIGSKPRSLMSRQVVTSSEGCWDQSE
jgi:hypothetical protein